MKIVLLTGLDGSGKSTLLSKLEELSMGSWAFLKVPVIDAGKYKTNPELYKVSVFINKLNHQADEMALPQLKLIAIFASMLIFKDLLEELKKLPVAVIFCERHPLIDTKVYGHFYAGKLDPGSFPASLAADIDKLYAEELDYLLRKMNVPGSGDQKNRMRTLLNFLYSNFIAGKQFEMNTLLQFFPVTMPDKIIYLKADAAILMSRLADRQVKEAHESLAVFEKMIPLYDQVLQASGVETEITDANHFENLDRAFEKIKQTYLSTDL